MITPRATRLHRAPDPAAFRAAIARLVDAWPPELRRDAFVLVPTTPAAEQLRRTLEQRLLAAHRPALLLPAIGPRASWMEALRLRLADPPRLLTEFEREVLLAAAARQADGGGTPAPFRLRPALVAEMLALYDALRRQRRTVARFEEYLVEELEPAVEIDRGAARMLGQTRFLAAAFRGYEARLAACGAVDEHALRERLLAETPDRPLRAVIVATGDRLADPGGLWPADIDLLTRVPDLERLHVIASERQLTAGALERLHEALPGVEEVREEPSRVGRALLQVPEPGRWAYTSRDREEELAAVARRIKAARRDGRLRPSTRVALVVRRPLPYLYLARDVLARAGIAYETQDTLPLAAEPFAAALDLVFECAVTLCARPGLVALLRSPHFRLAPGDAPVPAASIAALDHALADARYFGDANRLAALVDAWEAGATLPAASRGDRRLATALPAARAALAAARRLQPLVTPGPAVAQLDTLLDWLRDAERPPDGPAALRSRELRVRSAVVGALRELQQAYAGHDADAPLDAALLAATVRRWLGQRTFAPRTGSGGVQIVDATAAPFGEFDDVHVLGLVDGDWPERERRSIFYPALLLRNLGWPDEKGRVAAARAAFLDLLELPGDRLTLSTITLEDDALVEPSALLDDVPAAAPLVQVAGAADATRVFPWEALAGEPVRPEGAGEDALAWAAHRPIDTSDGAGFHGEAGPWRLPRLSVSRVERYLECPFRFFASEVLQLAEEAEDQDTRSPLERGRFLHELFERFFAAWQQRGHAEITADLLDEARRVFDELSAAALATLPPAEAAIERLKLHGSTAAPGIAERVLTLEAEREAAVVQRLLEHPLDGQFTFTGANGDVRRLTLRAKADRIDLLADGRFHLIDYKTRGVPDPKRALQLPVYALCATEQLRGHRGRDWQLGDASYLSYEGDRAVVPLARDDAGRGRRLADAQVELLGALDAIDAGHFPPRPALRSLCNSCAYAAVCRRDYVVEEPAAADVAAADVPVDDAEPAADE